MIAAQRLASRRLASVAPLLGLWLGLCGPVFAQADGTHVVQPGDTLYHLAQRYLEDPREWPRLQAVNQVRDPTRLMPGRTLVIPAALMREPPVAAEVLHVSGQASAQGPEAAAAPLATGQRLAEGTRIEVGDGGFVSLRLADGSVVRLATGTVLHLRELRHEPASGRTQSVFELERGRVDSTVKPLPAASRNRFEVRTPLAVGGVRGTDFGVAIGANGEFIGDVREGEIQVTPSSAPSGYSPTVVRAGEGAHVGQAAAVEVTPLLAAPDLSGLPGVQEDISWIGLPLSAQAGAAGWQVRIAADDAGDRVLRNGTFTEPLARFAGLEDGRYQLAVRALDARGTPGGEAVRELIVNARPQAPLLIEPRQNGRVPAPDVELRCTEGTGAEGYRFEVARDPGFAMLAASSADVAQCSHTVHALQPGRYHWRVAAVARDAQGQRDQGPFSPPAVFTVTALPPAPGHLDMRTGNRNTLDLQWSASPGGPWRHRIQIASTPDFARPLDDRELAQPALSRPLPPPGTYHVRVRQIDGDGLQGPWSDTQRLEVPARVVTSDQQPLTNTEGAPISPGAR